MEQVQVQLALSCPSRNDDLFYYLATRVSSNDFQRCFDRIFWGGDSRLSVQLTDSPVVRD